MAIDYEALGNIDHINLLLIGFAKPKLFSPRVKNPYDRDLIFKSFTQEAFLKCLSTPAANNIFFKHIFSCKNQKIIIH